MWEDERLALARGWCASEAERGAKDEATWACLVAYRRPSRGSELSAACPRMWCRGVRIGCDSPCKHSVYKFAVTFVTAVGSDRDRVHSSC